MANLPPRPETPPSVRDDRRYPPDDRDRDRRSAQPMSASRFRPNDRIPERDRSYVPRKPDSYIPGGHDSRRENDRRDYDDRDRDQDRYRGFDRDRDRRNHGRERDRDYGRSPRRRSPDRRQHDSRLYRRPPSPPPTRRSGFSRRDSRSPPPSRYQRRSPSPYRQRHRSRSRHASPPARQIKLGNHSIATSPLDRSPHKRAGSRDLSRSLDRRPSPSIVPPSSSEQRPSNIKPPLDISEPAKVEELGRKEVQENSPVKVEEKHTDSAFSDAKPSEEVVEIRITADNGGPQAAPSQLQPTLEQEEIKIDKPEPPVPSLVDVIYMKRIDDVDDNKMDIGDSPAVPSAPALSPSIPALTTRSPSLKSSSASNDYQRGAPNALQSNWPNRSPPRPRSPPRAPRSPPRAPRNHRPQGAPQISYPNGPRESRRTHPLPTFPGLPTIPKYERPKFMSDLEQEISKHETLRRSYATSHLQEVKGLQRALHELDMASIDLHAAETRHRIADVQLEKAKTGSLGIDAPDIIELLIPILWALWEELDFV